MIKEKNFPPARSTESGFLQVKNAKFTPSKFDIKIEKLSHKDHKVHGEILMNGRIWFLCVLGELCERNKWFFSKNLRKMLTAEMPQVLKNLTSVKDYVINLLVINKMTI